MKKKNPFMPEGWRDPNTSADSWWKPDSTADKDSWWKKTKQKNKTKNTKPNIFVKDDPNGRL